MIISLLQERLAEVSPFVAISATIGLLTFLGILTNHSSKSEPILPGIPKLKGYPIVGAIPIYFRHGMAILLETLTKLGDDGISYARVGNKTLVSVHDPAMVKEVLSFTDKVASRLGDPKIFSWSPFWTLIRLLDNNLFDDVGHEAMRQRGVFIREFNNPLSNVGKFNDILKVVNEHVDAITAEDPKARVEDIRHTADHFAAGLWGSVLYGRSDHKTDGRVMDVAEEILRRAGSPWPSMLYSVLLFFGLVEAGKPTPAESKVRQEIEDIYEDNMKHLEKFEHDYPDEPVRTIRTLSMRDGGAATGPLTIFATRFSRLNIFGGHHSIGSNITWSLIELQKHPLYLDKLLAEINAIETLDFETVTTKMPYLDAVIMEINRLYPSVPATLRVIERETRLVSCKKEVILRPGMLVYLSYLHMHTAPEFWGPNAGEFDPDRFLGGVDKSLPFMAFGYGTRDCVGYKFAILSVKMYLIVLLQKYLFDVEQNNCQVKLNTLLETSGPVGIEFQRR